MSFWHCFKASGGALGVSCMDVFYSAWVVGILDDGSEPYEKIIDKYCIFSCRNESKYHKKSIFFKSLVHFFAINCRDKKR